MSYQETLRESITHKFIEALEAGTNPWRQPWSGGGMPMNLNSKKYYKGINTWLLMFHQMAYKFNSNIYATFNQWRDKGVYVKKRPANVKEGEWGCPIIFFSPIKKEKTLPSGEVKEVVFPLMRSYTVFNADQVEGENAKKYQTTGKLNDIPPHDQAEMILKGSGATIKHGGNEAYYRPSEDYIQLPERNRFINTNSYYGTAMHELTHWSGHESRLKRIERFHRFGSSAYAMEELVAEIGGCYLLGAAGIPVQDKLENHASYVEHWLGILKQDNKAIFQASSAASAAADFILKAAGLLEEETVEEEVAV